MRIKHKALLILLTAVLLAGCGATGSGNTEPLINENTEDMTAAPDQALLADSLDKAVLKQIDTDGRRLLLYSLKAQKSYILTYDSATGIKDKYDQELSAAQLQPGDLLTVSFIHSNRMAKGIWLDPAMQCEESVTDFELHITSGSIEAAGQSFSLSRDCLVLSHGQELSLDDISDGDTLSVFYTDKEAYALVITRGHGYVRLSGADSFEGGWVEFGSDVICQVAPDEVYVVPEGSYQMLISKGKDSGIKDIEVLAGEETLVDVSDIITEADRSGQIVFTITPQGAVLTIDGQETDYSDVVTLSYGVHQVVASMEGYQTVTQYIKVGEPMANLAITLEETQAGSTDTATSDTVSSDSAPAPVSASEGDEHKVYIDGPSGAELYVDGAYVGIIPVSFPKKSGRHTLSLKREGYISRSYTLEIDDGQNDNHYSFSSLQSSSTATADADLAKSALSSLLNSSLDLGLDQ